MKKQITLLLFLLIHLSAWNQKSITNNGSCTDAMAHNAKGRWIKTGDLADLSSINAKEAYSRLNEIHDMMLKIYPQPTGVDAVWHRSGGLNYFGAKQKYFDPKDGPTNSISLPHFVQYSYASKFFDYRCYEGKMIPGYPGETGAVMTVVANRFDHFTGDGIDCDMNLGGLPVKMRNVLKGKWKGYDLYGPQAGSSGSTVLIHRPGMLPYIPVTRKQYLDHSIKHLTAMYDKIIKGFEQMPVRSPEEQEKEKNSKLEKFKKDFGSDPKKLKSTVDYYLAGYQTEQQRRDEQVNESKKYKKDIVKRYQDELEKTTNEGLLDSPACVVVIHSPDLTTPIFVAEDKGHMLVTDNPDYIRKDLPKYIPQFFVLNWRGMSSGVRGEVGKVINEKFPIEKLQAMIR